MNVKQAKCLWILLIPLLKDDDAHWCYEWADQMQRELFAWVDYIQSQWLGKSGVKDANHLKRCEISSQITSAGVENDELKWNFQHIDFGIRTNIMTLILLISGHSWATMEGMIITHCGCLWTPRAVQNCLLVVLPTDLRIVTITKQRYVVTNETTWRTHTATDNH